MTITHIFGESVDDIARAVLAIDARRGPDGDVLVEASFEPEVALPFRRALMRIEADLLRIEADGLREETVERSEPQRRAAAFMELVRRYSEAVAS